MQKTQQKRLRTVKGPFKLGKLPPVFIYKRRLTAFWVFAFVSEVDWANYRLHGSALAMILPQ